ncbi:cytochrome c biogenesis CcdA family protein [Clostridium tepidum]|jgi:cytochrome c biogenesis protein CcdA|uniref:Cytochrome C biogenesis protein n=1 Tax=Clostridium tepidum TaxID=1962263 RepID=A0A1S9I282_9CLOT|nr:cytochrome c biogenesis CcdA family protein [Clostridium tepidum]MCR1933091.1 cytochrome c biogenesis CcdA family protein [Clostridium tepidum]MDU6877261.1 cytochrome c biogenesis CcdA family protein [Clostridium botulinum]OOO62842.1 cytochrome C biogenesis protein [Clostridium tepidum]OOO64447.1 cytochrome C biogenesis protein [Clostridium tepidum]
MNDIITKGINLMGDSVFLALLISFLGGIISSFSPCVLSSIPLIIGYVNKYGKDNKKTAFKYSLFFSLGIVVTFTTLGIVSSLIGRIFTSGGKLWYLLLGSIMLFVGLQIIGVIEPKNKSCKVPKRKKGILGAFFLGILGGVLSSPCSTPVLIAILAFVGSKGNILLGFLMLFLYSVGHCFVIILSGISLSFAESLSQSSKANKVNNLLKIILGINILAIGLYLIYLGI